MQTSTSAKASGTDTQCVAYSRLFSTSSSSYRPNMGDIGTLSAYHSSSYGHGLELEGTSYLRIRTYDNDGRIALDYGDIYFHKAATVGSDRRLKYNINVLDQRYDNFFDALLPVSYGLGDELLEKTHTGFIAQEVEAALHHAGLTNDQFAGLTPPINETEYYSIAYTEFIALNTWQIQQLKPRVTAAEEEIEKLKLEIAQLREEIKNLQNS